DGAANRLHTAGNPIDGKCGSRNQPADEAAARFIVAPQQHEDGEKQHQGRQKGSDGSEDQCIHGRSTPRSSGLSGSFAASLRSLRARTRISARMARPVTATTAISPSVSVPRKSTMMTLTTLAPWATVFE